jgi:hypothetical protein
MRVRNSSAEHLGLITLDENVDHTRWPCISHPGNMTCEQAIKAATVRGLRTLAPAPSPHQARPFPQPQQER